MTGVCRLRSGPFKPSSTGTSLLDGEGNITVISQVAWNTLLRRYHDQHLSKRKRGLLILADK